MDGRTRRTATPTLSAEEELEAYEGLRQRDLASFRRVASRLEPLFHRLLGLATDDRRAARLAVADMWAVRLRALGMFTWNTTFTAWLAAGVVQRGRVLAAPGTPPWTLPPTTSPAVPGPVDWEDLPFGPRWSDATPLVTRGRAALPLPVREVLHVHHVERWSADQGCALLGHTAARYAQLLDDGHVHLHDVLARHVGEVPTDRVPADRIAPIGAVLRLVHGPHDPPPTSPDPLAMVSYAAWARELHPRLIGASRWVLSRVPR